MKLADYVMQRLADAGIRRVYGVYGSANAELFDAFHRVKDLTPITTIHEQSAGFAAEADAKVTGGLGCALATSGPGALNLVSAIANCYYDSVPVIFLTGNSPKAFQRREGERQRGFQECPIADVVEPITKRATTLRSAEWVRYNVEKAIWTAQEGRPGPVLLDIPADLQKIDIDPRTQQGFTPPSGTDDTKALDRFAASIHLALQHAERPLLLVGGGARRAAWFVREFSKAYGIPAIPTWNALDIIPDDFELFGGTVGTYGCGRGRNFAIQQADLVICLGTRISGRITGGLEGDFLRAAKWIFHADIDPSVVDGTPFVEREGATALAADVEDVMEALGTRPREVPPGRFDAWVQQVKHWRDTYDAVRESEHSPVLNPYAFVAALSEAAPSSAIITSECGGNAVIMHQGFRTKTGQRFFSSHGNSPMGGGLSYGIGAALAAPDRPVICTVGDGGLSASMQELLSLKIHREKLRNLHIFILNNHHFGITAAYQRTNLKDSPPIACGPDESTGYAAPNFVEIARAYGVDADKLRASPSAEALRGLIYTAGPKVWNVDCGLWSNYEPRVSGWGRPIEEATPSLPEEEFQKNMQHVEPLADWQKRRGR